MGSGGTFEPPPLRCRRPTEEISPTIKDPPRRSVRQTRRDAKRLVGTQLGAGLGGSAQERRTSQLDRARKREEDRSKSLTPPQGESDKRNSQLLPLVNEKQDGRRDSPSLGLRRPPWCVIVNKSTAGCGCNWRDGRWIPSPFPTILKPISTLQPLGRLAKSEGQRCLFIRETRFGLVGLPKGADMGAFV